MQEQARTLETAIVGGGVSGLYCAWRLSHAEGYRPGSVEVFEHSDRTGGRLWSVTLDQEQAIPAELGGMFFSDAQDLVYRLCVDVLGLEKQDVTPANDFAWVRGHRFMMDDFTKPGVLPYDLREDEQGLTEHEIIMLAVRKIAPEVDQYWPLNPDSSMTETVRYLREAEYEGRALHQWGFWNLLARVISNEARKCVEDVEGSYALFSNWNGMEAVFSILSDLTGTWHRLPNGYQQLPNTLRTQAEQRGVTVHYQASLLAVSEPDHDGLRTLYFDGDAPPIKARKVILALPTGALQMLDLDVSDAFHQALYACERVPACKIFMVFDQTWWEDVPEGPGRIELGHFSASHTDLPMRQCYYLGTDPGTGRGLLLGAFGDNRSVEFWPALLNHDEANPQKVRPIPDLMRDELVRQLREMHDYEVPEPVDALFVDWSQPPYWAGWHGWRAGYKSWEVAARLRHSPDDPGLHVCGEAYSAWQGWTEGALTSAEMLLTDTLGLKPLEWLQDTDCLAPYNQ
ncbi:MAG: NAD(P)/FAD-dependent oxidoreductase [Pseudomonadota bacterium]